MWTAAAALLLSLAPHQDGKLAIANLRATYGVPGIVRETSRVSPGDVLYLCFDITGVKLNAEGNATYSLTTEIKNGAGETQFKHAGKPVTVKAFLGGDRISAYTTVDVGSKQKAGEYTVSISVNDEGAIASTKASFTLAEPEFALVHVLTALDAERKGIASTFTVGQIAHLSGQIVGFKRNDVGAPDLKVELVILDDQGNPTNKTPITGSIDSKSKVPSGAVALPVQVPVSLNRPGKFTAVIKVTDQVTGKTSGLKLPLVVSESK